MRNFFIWLVIQLVFARALLGMVIMAWKDLHVPPDYLAVFIVPACLVCIVETIVSGVMIYQLTWRLQSGRGY